MNEKRGLGAGIFALFGVCVVPAVALADPPVSPALFAKFNTYNQAGAEPGQNSLCFNDPESMREGRQSSCSTSRVRTSVGVSTITITNGKPFDEFFDAGYTIFVTAVGSNALCRETATWVPAGTNDLKSTIRCVTPAGAPVDTAISWFYRADSHADMQFGHYNHNFAYARFNRANPTRLVSAESFNAYGQTPDGVTNARLGVGQYRVTFVQAGTNNTDGLNLALGLGNVQAQPTCSNDNTTACRRAHCRIAAQTTTTVNTTVDVHCYSGGAARDTDFRVFLGSESHSNQVVPDELAFILQGSQYGWARVPTISTPNGCLSSSAFLHKNHNPSVDSPSLALPLCRTSTGVYRLNFNAHGGFYKKDTVSMIATPLSANTYCNLGAVSCGDGLCGGGQNVYLDVLCFNHQGNAVNTAFNMSMIYN
jgi:hypothetical protein